MSEQIKTTTVDQLPEADNLDGLYVFGYASKNAVGRRSVKAPITLLKGNKGDIPTIGANGNWWISGKDTGFPARGQDGEVTTEQLNEAIENSMKTYAEKYDVAITVGMNNISSDVAKTTQIMDVTPSVKTDSVEYVRKASYLEQIGSSVVGSFLTLLHTYIKENDNLSIYMNNVSEIIFSRVAKISHLTISTKSNKLKLVSVEKSTLTGLDVSACHSLERLVVAETNLSSLDIVTLKSISNINAQGSPSMQYIICNGDKLVTLQAQNSPKLEYITILLSTPDLRYVYIEKTLINATRLMQIEAKWTSRVGKDTGVLRLDKTLYDTLTSEQRKKFTDKNITFDIVG